VRHARETLSRIRSERPDGEGANEGKDGIADTPGSATDYE
jgi:hypothetical protein